MMGTTISSSTYHYYLGSCGSCDLAALPNNAICNVLAEYVEACPTPALLFTAGGCVSSDYAVQTPACGSLSPMMSSLPGSNVQMHTTSAMSPTNSVSGLQNSTPAPASTAGSIAFVSANSAGLSFSMAQRATSNDVTSKVVSSQQSPSSLTFPSSALGNISVTTKLMVHISGMLVDQALIFAFVSEIARRPGFILSVQRTIIASFKSTRTVNNKHTNVAHDEHDTIIEYRD